MKENAVVSEAAFKRREAAAGRIMQHAQIGYRDLEASRRAWGEIYETCDKAGVRVARYGITLDWTMGLSARPAGGAPSRGLGLLLDGPEDFVRTDCERHR